MGTGYTRNDTANNIADGNVIDAADLDGEFDAVEAAFNSSTGHTHDGTSAEGGAITVLGPTQEFVATANEVRPSTNNGLNIGTALVQFNDLYASGTATLGNILADGLTVNDKAYLEGTNPYLAINDTDVTDLNTMLRTQSGIGYINTINDAYDTVTKRISVDHATGDISFYEDTGTTAKFFWDASAESLGIGETSPSAKLHLKDSSQPVTLRLEGTDSGANNGPILDLYRNSSTPAADDQIGEIYFSGEDDGGGKHQYAKIEAFIEDATAGSEGGRLSFNVITNGSGSQMLTLRSDTGGTDGEVVINEPGDVVNFRIEGSTDARLFVTDAANDAVVIGHDTAQGIGGATPVPLQVAGTTGATSSMGIVRHQNTSSGPSIRFARSRTSTVGDVTIVQDDDQLGSINFYGADGTDLASIGAQIVARVDGTPGVDDMPGSLEFWTTADGANTGTQRMVINSQGRIGIGTDSPEDIIHVVASGSNDARIQLENVTNPRNNFIGMENSDEVVIAADEDNTGTDSNIRFRVDASERMRMTGTEVVVNDGGNDVNFRVETAGNANTFVVDAGTNWIGMHTATSVSLNGYRERVRIASDGNNLGGSLVMSANNGGRTSNSAENDIVFYDTDGVITNNQNSGSIRWYGLDASGPGAGMKAGIRGRAQADGRLYFEFWSASTTANYVKSASLSSTVFQPGSDNVADLGASGTRWDDVYATNGTIQTSDERLKQQVASLTADEMNAAKAISALFKTYKWNDKVAEKGDNARIHSGVIAQQVKSAMENNNLDPMKYAFFCWNEYYEIEVSGEDIATPYMETFEVGDPDIPEGATYVDRYSIRYGELMSFIHAATEQRLASIESRLDALESA